MLIREYKESDLAALRAIHAAQAFEYALPDLSNPLFVTKLVLSDAVANVTPSLVGARFSASPEAHASRDENDAATEHPHEAGSAKNFPAGREGNCPPADRHGRILGAALLRLTAEAYLLLDPKAGTPRERWQWLLALHAAAERDAWLRGLEDVHAWLPPPIAKKFGTRIARLGWRRDDTWTPYCKKLSAPTFLL
jgi:hypothetical protein